MMRTLVAVLLTVSASVLQAANGAFAHEAVIDPPEIARAGILAYTSDPKPMPRPMPESPPELTASSVPVPQAAPNRPVKVIFDTDMDTDCDDAAALAMMHALADRGEIELLGTMVSSKYRWSGQATAAINTYFGRPDLPVGVPKGPGNVEHGDRRGSKYARQIAEEFPHNFAPAENAPDASTAYRKILAAQPDASVVVVTVGYLTNIRYLLDSGPDEHSGLTGVELVKRKVKEWVCMGSRYPADLDPAQWGNFKPDAESAFRAVNAWPGQITFTGGGAFAESLATGRVLNSLPKDNPVRRVYELYFGGDVKDRHSADQIAVLVAARGAGRPWKLVTYGYNHIFPNGTHEWRDDTDNPLHRYVSSLERGEDPRVVAAEIENLMLMATRRAGRIKK